MDKEAQRGGKAFYLERGLKNYHLTDSQIIRYIVYEMINA